MYRLQVNFFKEDFPYSCQLRLLVISRWSPMFTSKERHAITVQFQYFLDSPTISKVIFATETARGTLLRLISSTVVMKRDLKTQN